MGVLHHSVATLRLLGDDLVPEEVTALLGASPDDAVRKGETLTGRATGHTRIARTGRWSIGAENREPEDLNAQVFEILDRLTDDLSIWRSLSARFRLDLFCGLFMSSGNDGLELSPDAMAALGQRGIVLSLDIYDADDDDAEV